MNLKSLVLGCALAAGLSIASAQAAVVNGGFETGDLTGWTANAGALGSVNVVTSSLGASVDGMGVVYIFGPTEGNYFAELTAGEEGVYTTMFREITLSIASYVSFDAAFQNNDDTANSDDVYVQILGLPPIYAANTLTYSDFAAANPDTGAIWDHYSVLLGPGTYTLEAGVRNSTAGEATYSSRLLLDNVSAVAVPEPGAWTLMIVGFGAAGAMVRVNRRRLAA